MTISKLYNQLIFNYDKLKQPQISMMLYNLNLLSLALYTKNLTKDNRNLSQLAKIVQEELYV